MTQRRSFAAWRWLSYLIVSRVVHQVDLLRGLARLLQWLPSLEASASAAVRARTVQAVFLRDASFSNTAHAPNLVAGPFAIGLESGPRHDAERAELRRRLPPASQFGDAALASAEAKIGQIRGSHPQRFDLVEDYLLQVVWAGMRHIFGTAATALESTPGGPSGRGASRVLFDELRYIGAHLVVGGVAPPSVQQRAETMAAALRDRVMLHLPALRNAWNDTVSTDEQLCQRAVGLMWVGHPATVQAGALVMQEWLQRPSALDTLHRQVLACGDAAWTDAGLRADIQAHVVEALRLRPPFPLLKRQVLRDTFFTVDGKHRSTCKAGTSVVLLSVAAMAESTGDGFCPHRTPTPHHAGGPFHLIFGLGARECIAQHQVVEMLTSAMLGLLTLPRLHWADAAWGRIRYDGPTIVRMRLRF